MGFLVALWFFFHGWSLSQAAGTHVARAAAPSGANRRNSEDEHPEMPGTQFIQVTSGLPWVVWIGSRKHFLDARFSWISPGPPTVGPFFDDLF